MRHHVLILLCVMAAIAYVQRAAISVPQLEIGRNFQVPEESLATAMGSVMSAWYLGYAIFQIPSGWLIDRVGSRLTVAWFCVLWSVLTFATGFCTGMNSLTVLWFLMGSAQAGAFPCAAKAIGQIYPESERARASGILAAGMAVGGAIAPLITAQALGWFDTPAASLDVFRWRLLLFALAFPGIIWSIAFVLSIRPAALPYVPNITSERGASALIWHRICSSRTLALLCAQQFFRAAAMVFFLTSFPAFLQSTRGVSLKESGLLTTIAGAGGVIGSLAGGVVSDWLLARTGNKRLSRQGIAVFGMGSCAILITISVFVQNTSLSIAIISLGTFCATFGGVSGYTVAIEFGGKQAGTVFSTMNMFGNIGAMLFPITAGRLVDMSGDWNLVMFFFAGIMAVDAVCWAVLNPKEPLFV